MSDSLSNQIDVIIIGGGPAGMSAALVLGRARRHVLVIDEALPRNRVTHESHGFLTRDGIAPAEFRQIAREQILAYPSVSFVQETVMNVTGTDGHFEVTTSSGTTYQSAKIIFATGMKDAPLEIKGLQDVYGKSAFVCPYCDGWEMQDRPTAILAGEHTLHLTRTLSGWSSDLIVFTDGNPRPDEEVEQLSSRGIPVYDAKVREILSENGKVSAILLEDGTEVPRTAIFFAPKLISGSDLPQKLGCTMTDFGAMQVDEMGRSNIPGVFGTGDSASRMYQIAAAVSSGSLVGVMINSEFLEREWENR